MRRLAPALSAALCAIGLSGCVDNLPEFRASAGDVRATVANGVTGSPRGATVAVVSLAGAPEAIASRFNQAFAKEAAAREITTVDAATAHYFVRGYLSASPGDGGTDVIYVYDIFDANDQQRFDRVTDSISVPTSGGNPWAEANDQVIASLASLSADALASALATTPAAQAALTPTLAQNTTH